VTGRFSRFDGALEIGDDGAAQIVLTIAAASLETGNRTRDKHLRSPAFFAVDDHPSVRFASTDTAEEADGKLRVTGVLEAAGVEVPLEFDATARPLPHGELEIEAAAMVDPREFGMTWSPLGMVRPQATLIVKARLTQPPSNPGKGK
jgi:polyisoprenoid-binding protein YceI